MNSGCWIDFREKKTKRLRLRRLFGPGVVRHLRSVPGFTDVRELVAGPEAAVRFYRSDQPASGSRWIQPNGAIDGAEFLTLLLRYDSIEIVSRRAQQTAALAS